MSQNPPALLGRYQIIREIARSNDIVYEAFDPQMNRRVAVKELAMPVGATSSQQDARRQRFLREARAAGSLVHPNIVTVFEVGQEEGRYFIAMEYLDGRTLRSDIDSSGFLKLNRAVEIAKAVLSALDFAHSKGVIHRDIKPDNVQLLSSGAVKITDFGIARLTFEPNITMDGQIFGTPSYMSPEQIHGKDIDPRSDIFSVGTILFEMIGGQKPFSGDSVVSISYSIMNHRPTQPSACPWGVWQVIERALEKTPSLRWNSAGEMMDALTKALDQSRNVVMTAPPPPPVYSPAQGTTIHQYGVQPPPILQPPPVQQPSSYQPYGAIPTMGGQPYNPYGASQSPSIPGMPFPVYYPPPPRPPLFTPEFKAVMGKAMLMLVLIGGITAAIIVPILNFGTQVEKNPYRPASPNGASAPTLDWRTLIAKAGGEVEAGEREAIDSRRTGYWDDAADLLAQTAKDIPDRAPQIYDEGGRMFLNAAIRLANAGERVRARQAANYALGFAQGNASLRQEIENLLGQLGV